MSLIACLPSQQLLTFHQLAVIVPAIAARSNSPICHARVWTPNLTDHLVASGSLIETFVACCSAGAGGWSRVTPCLVSNPTYWRGYTIDNVFAPPGFGEAAVPACEVRSDYRLVELPAPTLASR